MHAVGLVVYPRFQALGLAVTTVFEYANLLTSPSSPTYSVSVVSEHGGPIRASQGITVETESLSGRTFDTLIVTGDNEASLPTARLAPGVSPPPAAPPAPATPAKARGEQCTPTAQSPRTGVLR